MDSFVPNIVKKNLVLATVGDESVHRTWLAGTERSFDLALIYFGNTSGRFAEDGEFYFPRKGIKFSLLHQVLRNELNSELDRYDHIWMPDDDIGASAAQVNRLFELAREHRLAICQPAVGKGDVSFKALRAQPKYVLRYSRFVEIMCPLFSRAALERALPTFNLNVSAWGIDWVWASMFGPEELAVVDAVAVHHTRPLKSGGVHSRLAALGVDPNEEHRELMRRFGIHNHRFHKATCRGTARLRALRLDGQKVWTRSWLSAMLGRNAA
jgi:hypothetical protein